MPFSAVRLVPGNELNLHVLLFASQLYPGVLPMQSHELVATLVSAGRAWHRVHKNSGRDNCKQTTT
jgi:hypothetical protein